MPVVNTFQAIAFICTIRSRNDNSQQLHRHDKLSFSRGACRDEMPPKAAKAAAKAMDSTKFLRES